MKKAIVLGSLIGLSFVLNNDVFSMKESSENSDENKQRQNTTRVRQNQQNNKPRKANNSETNTNALDNHGKTALHYAVENGDTNVVSKLLEDSEIDINAQDKHGETALHCAVRRGDTNIVSILLSNPGIDANIKGRNKQTVLHAAVSLYDSQSPAEVRKMIEFLFDELKKNHLEIDVNAKDHFGRTVLHYAVEYDDIAVVSMLLNDSEININTLYFYGETILHYAVENGDTNVISMLLSDQRIDINAKDEYGKTALHYAVKHGDIDVISMLLNDSKNVINASDNHGKTALHYAVNHGNTDVISMLLNNPGISINAQDKNGETALHYAVENGDINIVSMLLDDQRINVSINDFDGQTLLHKAVLSYDFQSWKDKSKMIEFLLDELKKNHLEIDVNARDRFGQTALHYAVPTDEYQFDEDGINTVIWLLERLGIDKNITDCNGWTFLCRIAELGDLNLFNKVLPYYNAENSEDIEDMSRAIYAAVKGSNAEIVQILLEFQNTDPNFKVNGKNALFAAVEDGKADIVEMLLKNERVDPNINCIGRFPIDIAIGQYNILTGAIDHLKGKNRVRFGWQSGELSELFENLESYQKIIELLLPRSSLPLLIDNISKVRNTQLFKKQGFLLNQDFNRVIPQAMLTAMANGNPHFVQYWLSKIKSESLTIDFSAMPENALLTVINGLLSSKYKDAQEFFERHREELKFYKQNVPPFWDALRKPRNSRDAISDFAYRLLELGIDIYKYGITNSDDLERLLLEKKEEEKDVKKVYIDVIELLLKQNAFNVNVQNGPKETPLHLVIEAKGLDTKIRFEIIKLLTSSKEIDVNIQSNQGKTPLHLAVKSSELNLKEKLEIIELLMSKGANVNVQNAQKETPIHMAARLDDNSYIRASRGKLYNTDIVQLLISGKRADISIKNTEGNTPLHVAAAYNNGETISHLVNHCINDEASAINAVNNNGQTPLHVAVMNSNSKAIEALLAFYRNSKVCDLNIRDKEEKTAADIALDKGNWEAFEQMLVIGCEFCTQPEVLEQRIFDHLSDGKNIELVKIYINKLWPTIDEESRQGIEKEIIKLARRDDRALCYPYAIVFYGEKYDSRYPGIRLNTPSGAALRAIVDWKYEQEKEYDDQIDEATLRKNLHAAAKSGNKNEIKKLIEKLWPMKNASQRETITKNITKEAPNKKTKESIAKCVEEANKKYPLDESSDDDYDDQYNESDNNDNDDDSDKKTSKSKSKKKSHNDDDDDSDQKKQSSKKGSRK